MRLTRPLAPGRAEVGAVSVEQWLAYGIGELDQVLGALSGDAAEQERKAEGIRDAQKARRDSAQAQIAYLQSELKGADAGGATLQIGGVALPLPLVITAVGAAVLAVL